MEPRSPSKLKLPISGFTQLKRILTILVSLFIVLLLSVSVYLAFNPVKSPNALQNSYYTVVVDCGSTGTRVNVYEWEKRGLVNCDLPILVHSFPDNSTESPVRKESCKYHCLQTEPGLHEFVGNTSGVRASLEPLILWAEQRVPRERHRDTPIFVLATAGLRRLAIENARQVLDDIEAFVKEHSFVYDRSWIRILSGKEEAYYGWVALNYKMGTLGNSSRASTLGLLDLGGSSLQVVGEVNDMRDNTSLITSKLGSIYHQILAYSLPAFGLNEAFDRTVGMLTQVQTLNENTTNRLEIRHPCLSSRLVQNYTCLSCSMLNITGQKNMGSQMHKAEYAATYLVGNPNWEQCRVLVSAAAVNYSGPDWSNQIADHDCKTNLSSYNGSTSLNLTTVSYSTRRFHALSGFFVVQTQLNLSPIASLTEIWKKGKTLCLESWNDMSSAPQKKRYADRFCFQMPYVASLIENALCLGNAEIYFGPGDISWTLGAALVEGQYQWLDTNETPAIISTSMSIEIFSSPIFICFLLLSLLLIVYCSQVKLPMPLPAKKVSSAGTSLPSYVHLKYRPN